MMPLYKNLLDSIHFSIVAFTCRSHERIICSVVVKLVATRRTEFRLLRTERGLCFFIACAFVFFRCWSPEISCQKSSCTATSQKLNNTFFCCCTGDMCNDNVDVMTISTQPPVVPDPEDDNKRNMVIVVLVIVGVGFVMGCLAAVIFRFRKSKPLANAVPAEETPNSPSIDLDSLKFMESIGQGRYGTAYRAVVNGEEVAVKVFPQHYKSSFMNEKYIYSLPLMEHPNLLAYLGGGECTGPDGGLSYALVLSYCPLGRLSSYLAENTLSWSTFCQIVLSATRGLSHLHSDIRRGDITKPCVCHRDFNTRNLLLTENMSCVVSDLGFAIHTQGAKYYVNGDEQHAETSSLTDVGTLRYMAPEVLEGAVNLRDCEAALKQIDIYALGLVLWECAARCHDLYQGLQPPPHMLPFQAEIGLHPSFEQMQVLVARNKARPLFHPVWKDTNPAIRLLKETIEDCWDHDAEARLSAMCVEGRLSELPVLWERYKSSLGVNGVSPTINPMSHMGVTQRQGEMFSGLMGNGGKVISNALTPRDKESSISEATVETTITASSSAPAVEQTLGKNQLIGTLQPPMPPLQPHQGRNPCMERNLIREVPQELSVSGNTLIDHLKGNDVNALNTINSVNFMESLDVASVLESNGFVNEQLMPLLNGHSNTAALAQQRPTLPPPTLVPPIPYLQNEVRSIDNQPKKQNTAVREENQESGSSSGRGSSWRRWRNAWEDRLKSLIPRRHHHNGEDEERQEILITPTSSSLSEPPTPLTATQSVPATSPHLPVQTEVLLTNGGLHTVISPNHTLNTQHSSLPSYIAETEIGIAKLHLQNGFAPVIRSRQGSKDSGLNKSSENSVSFVDSDNSCEKLKRPTTLSLPEKSHQAVANNESEKQQVLADKERDKKLQEEKESHCEKKPVPETEVSPPLRKAKQRVKTPRRPMNPRLSLYDDRIMGCSEGSEGSGRGECKLEESLSHSLPIHMDTLEQQHQQQPFLSKPVIRTIASSQSTSSASLRRYSKVASSSNNDSHGSSHGSLTHEYHHPPHHLSQQPNIRATGDVL
ncbi:probable serine/threonine-protein kinase roco5 isoform X3 [Macrobrachium nipponense]|uniref:probable serine/threonine-protein kinase roco5 isoform X3 n=1 Tax=Macrobrachium nipponense TaxID=159736 RepID=UPI0030C883BA